MSLEDGWGPLTEAEEDVVDEEWVDAHVFEQAADFMVTLTNINPEWHDGMNGWSEHGTRKIGAPRPRCPRSFVVFAHEVGHHMLDHTTSRRILSHRHREEEAWAYALEVMDLFGMSAEAIAQAAEHARVQVGQRPK